ncbi:hypothetical protein RR48_05191, partial [Papilio machaon]
LVYTVSKFGKPVILLGKYRYNVHNRSKGPRARWLCCRRTTGCRASVTTVDATAQLIFTTSRYGKPVLQCGKYRYNRNNRSCGPKVLWVCCRVSSGCRASITTIDNIVVKEKSMHNH